eukprot:280708-Chlamydomonas_euryale.AAC.1
MARRSALLAMQNAGGLVRTACHAEVLAIWSAPLAMQSDGALIRTACHAGWWRFSPHCLPDEAPLFNRWQAVSELSVRQSDSRV